MVETITITDTTKSGTLFYTDALWNDVRQAPVASSLSKGTDNIGVTPGATDIYRGAFSFDLSAVPAGSIITLAKLQLFVWNKVFFVSTDIHMVKGDTNRPSGTPATDDYNYLFWDGNDILGTKASGDITDVSYNDFEFSDVSNFIGGVVNTFYMIEDGDYNDVEPLNLVYMIVDLSAGGNPPKLYLEYELGGNPGTKCISIF